MNSQHQARGGVASGLARRRKDRGLTASIPFAIVCLALLVIGTLSGGWGPGSAHATGTIAAQAGDEIADNDIARRVAQWRAIEQGSHRNRGANGLAAQADELMADVDLARLSGGQIRAAAEILRSSPRLLDTTRTLLAERARAPGATGYSASLDWFFVARHAPSGFPTDGLDPKELERDLAALIHHPEFAQALRRGDAFHLAHALTRISPEARRDLSPAVLAAVSADLQATPSGLYSATAALVTISRDSDAQATAEARAALLVQLEASAKTEQDPGWSGTLGQLSGLLRSSYLGRKPSERTPPDSLLVIEGNDAVSERRLSDFAGGVVVLVVANAEISAWQLEQLRSLRARFPKSDSSSLTMIALLPRTGDALAKSATAPRSDDLIVARCDPMDWHDPSDGLARPERGLLDGKPFQPACLCARCERCHRRR